MTSPRAIRYRRLALVEQDNEKAELLRQLADEADRGVLVTVEHPRVDKIEIPIKFGDNQNNQDRTQEADDHARNGHKRANWRTAIDRAEHKCEMCGGWFDMRDLGAVLDHKKPLPHPASDQAL
jgi:hypothetical protein